MWFTQVHICTISLTSNCIQTWACTEKLISDLKSVPKAPSESVKISNATQIYWKSVPLCYLFSEKRKQVKGNIVTHLDRARFSASKHYFSI